jgi:hypothetical protein
MNGHPALAAAAMALCACGWTYRIDVQSSSGSSYRMIGPVREYPRDNSGYALAALDSAANDLACPRAALRVASDTPPHFVVDGCGERAVYECALRPASRSRATFGYACTMVLVNRFALQRDGAPRPAEASE